MLSYFTMSHRTKYYYNILLNEIRNKNLILKLICSALFLFLLYEEVRVYLSVPTSTAIVKKELRGSKVPHMALCAEPAFDIQKLRKHGYEE